MLVERVVAQHLGDGRQPHFEKRGVEEVLDWFSDCPCRTVPLVRRCCTYAFYEVLDLLVQEHDSVAAHKHYIGRNLQQNVMRLALLSLDLGLVEVLHHDQ